VKVTQTVLPGVLIIDPAVFEDDRGFFMESWNQERFDSAAGYAVEFVQDNHSRSQQGVLRGLHYQNPRPQGKLVRVGEGSVWDVAVDIRPDSPTYTEWFGIELTAENKKQLWVPAGLAHGFLTLTETAQLLYKTSDYYYPAGDKAIKYDDPQIGIEWPQIGDLSLSAKDASAPSLSEAIDTASQA
jgi:dTDP-4-dehydrorhamnose 3,5-epimerase